MSQPAMRAGGPGTRWSASDHLGALRVLRRSWAITRWIVLVVACGIGAAAVLAIAVASLVALVQNI